MLHVTLNYITHVPVIVWKIKKNKNLGALQYKCSGVSLSAILNSKKLDLDHLNLKTPSLYKHQICHKMMSKTSKTTCCTQMRIQ